MDDQKTVESRWLSIVIDTAASATRKTDIWDVMTIDGLYSLGSIRWYGEWRGYAFFPGHSTIYNPECLRDIAAFIDSVNHDHRQQLKAEKENT